MNKHLIRTLSTTVLAALLCTTTPSCSNMTDDQLTQTQGVGISSVLGGLLGAGIGVALSSNSNSSSTKALAIAGGALLGAGIGAYVGKKWADSVVQAKHRYASDEAYALANLQQMRNRVSEASETNTTLRKEIASAQKAGRIDKQRLAAIRKNVNDGQQRIQKDISVANAALKGDNTAATNAELRKQISQLQQQSQELSNNLTRLEQLT